MYLASDNIGPILVTGSGSKVRNRMLVSRNMKKLLTCKSHSQLPLNPTTCKGVHDRPHSKQSTRLITAVRIWTDWTFFLFYNTQNATFFYILSKSFSSTFARPIVMIGPHVTGLLQSNLLSSHSPSEYRDKRRFYFNCLFLWIGVLTQPMRCHNSTEDMRHKKLTRKFQYSGLRTFVYYNIP